MAYSRSKYTLEKRLHLYSDLLLGKAAWWETANPVRLAAHIREGLYIAQLYAAEYPKIAAIAAHVKVSLVGARTVEARIDIPLLSEKLEIARESFAKLETIKDTPYTLAEILEAMEYPVNRMTFMQTTLTPTELHQLAGAMAAEGRMVLYVGRTSMLTIALDDPDIPAEAKVQP